MTPRQRVVAGAHGALWGLFVLWMLLRLVLPALAAPAPFGFHATPRSMSIQDFAAHFQFARAAWTGGARTLAGGGSIYTEAFHLAVIHRWTGEPVGATLVFPYAPTMLWLLLPLVGLAAAHAYVVVTLLGLAAVGWITRPRRSRDGLDLVAFLSPVGIGCLAIGQTAILSGAALLALRERSRKDVAAMPASTPPAGWRGLWPAALLLWALTARPPLALTAGALLLARRRWKVVVLAVGAALVSTLALWPVLGPHWWSDYLHLLGRYDVVHMSPVFAGSNHPEIMANLRGVLYADLGLRDDRAFGIAQTAWLVALAALALLGPRWRLPEGALWALGLLAYLALFPHVNPAEEIQLALLLPLCVGVDADRLRGTDLGIMLIACFAVFTVPLPGTLFGGRRLVLLALEAVAAALVMLGARESRLAAVGSEEAVTAPS